MEFYFKIKNKANLEKYGFENLQLRFKHEIYYWGTAKYIYNDSLSILENYKMYLFPITGVYGKDELKMFYQLIKDGLVILDNETIKIKNEIKEFKIKPNIDLIRLEEHGFKSELIKVNDNFFKVYKYNNGLCINKETRDIFLFNGLGIYGDSELKKFYDLIESDFIE